MKIREHDFYHGCVLAQIADYAASTKVAKVEGNPGMYEINGDRQILIKYSTVEGNEWEFSFRKDEIATLKPNEAHTLFFIALVCGYRTICLLGAADIDELIDEDAKKSQTITVTDDCGSSGSRMRVRNGDVILSRTVPHKSFPAALLDAPTPMEEPFAWPPLSTISVYRGPPNRLFSSDDRTLDLSDVLTCNLRESEVGTAYVGIATQSKAWEVWDENSLRRIEDRIRYLFEFDNFGIDIERVTTESNGWCTGEFVWKIEFWSDFGESDTLYDQAVALVLDSKRASNSLVQRHLHIGYHRAARLLDQMGKNGLVSALKSNGTRDILALTTSDTDAGSDSDHNTLYEQAVAIVRKYGRASISLVQRHLRIGYNLASKLMEEMEQHGLVSSMHSNGNRDVLVSPENDVIESSFDIEEEAVVPPRGTTSLPRILGARRSIMELDFVTPTRKSVSAIEIDVDFVPDGFRHGGWEELIVNITVQWVQEQSYTGTGTIMATSLPSVNFQHAGTSAFYVVLGMPAKFHKYLWAEFSRKLGVSAWRQSDDVVPCQRDGWNNRCHVEFGKTWMVEDAVSWREVVQ